MPKKLGKIGSSMLRIYFTFISTESKKVRGGSSQQKKISGGGQGGFAGLKDSVCADVQKNRPVSSSCCFQLP